MIRITADLDKTPLSIAKIRTLLIIKYLFERYDVLIEDYSVRLSSSKTGCHVVLWTKNKIDREFIFFIRYLLGDDWKRLRIDLNRRRSKQYLFKKKKVFYKNMRKWKKSKRN